MSKSRRRDFLRNSALAGFLAPLAAYWPAIPEAKAQLDAKRMVLVSMPNGKMREDPFVEGRAGERPVFQRGFEPYNEFADQAIAFRGYSMENLLRAADPRASSPGHVDAALTLYSGISPYPRPRDGLAFNGRAPSIDQVVASDYLQRGIIPSRLRKSLGIHVFGRVHQSIYSNFVEPLAGYELGQIYPGAELREKWVPHHLQPREGFQQMFDGVATVGGAPSVEGLWATGRAVVDVPQAELRGIRSQLPLEGARTIDEHLALMADLERELRPNNDPPPMIEPPMIPGVVPAVESGAGKLQALNLWNRVIESAFRFDRTRIATILFGGVACRFDIPSLGLGELVEDVNNGRPANDHHTYTHSDTGQVWKFSNWYSERVAALLGTLRDGNLLDSTAVMIGSEFGWGRGHICKDIPVAIFGNSDYYDLGQVVDYDNEDNGQQHTGTLLSMVKAMGTPLDFIGEEPFRGPVPGVLLR